MRRLNKITRASIATLFSLASASCAEETDSDVEFLQLETAESSDQLGVGEEETPELDDVLHCGERAMPEPIASITWMQPDVTDGRLEFSLELDADLPDLRDAEIQIEASVLAGLEELHRPGAFLSALDELDGRLVPTSGEDSGVLHASGVVAASAFDIDTLREDHGVVSLAATLWLANGSKRIVGSSDYWFHRHDDGRVVLYTAELRETVYADVWETFEERDKTVPAVPSDRLVFDVSPGDEEARQDVRVSVLEAADTPKDPRALNWFCFDVGVEYTDVTGSSGGEDVWWGTGTRNRPLIGARYQIFRNGGFLVASGFLSDGIGESEGGCTGQHLIDNGVPHYVVLDSFGRVNNNNIDVYTQNNTRASYGRWFTVYGGGKVDDAFVDTGEDQKAWTVYRAITRAMYRHNGGASNVDYVARVATPPGGGNGQFSNGTIFVNPGNTNQWWKRKYLITHEYGHAVPVLAHDTSFASDCGIDDGDPDVTADPNCLSNVNHKMWSVEWSSCAASEGWAHFVAADAWNGHGTNANCTFNYWRDRDVDGNNDVVNCEGSSSLYPNKFMRSQCLSNAPYNGLGVEVDWLRTFWDMHTGNSTWGKAGMAQLLGWIKLNAGGFSKENTYDMLDLAADESPAVVDQNWDFYAAYNGIND